MCIRCILFSLEALIASPCPDECPSIGSLHQMSVGELDQCFQRLEIPVVAAPRFMAILDLDNSRSEAQSFQLPAKFHGATMESPSGMQSHATPCPKTPHPITPCTEASKVCPAALQTYNVPGLSRSEIRFRQLQRADQLRRLDSWGNTCLTDDSSSPEDRS